MAVNMSLIYMGADDERMLPFSQTHRQLIADFVGSLRRNLTRLKGLPQVIGNNITITYPKALVTVRPLPVCSGIKRVVAI